MICKIIKYLNVYLYTYFNNNSPNSLEAIASLGIEEERLYYISFDDYIQQHPELKSVDRDLQERRYNHFEEKRKTFINEAIKRRREIIEEKKKTGVNNVKRRKRKIAVFEKSANNGVKKHN